MASTAEIPTQFTQEPTPEDIKYLKTSSQIKFTSPSYKRKSSKAKASSEHLQQDQSQVLHNTSQMQSNHNVTQNNSEEPKCAECRASKKH